MPDFAIPDCEDYQSEDFEFRELNNTDWPVHDSYENFTFLHVDQKQTCLNYCLTDCFCMVAVFGADGRWMRTLPLQYGQHGTYMNRTAYMKAETQLEIAVKKLEIANEGEREFKSEVYSIGQTNHKNLVKMIGFCYEGKHRMLIYEYMSKGSLARFIFGDTKLGWNQRAQIALGIANGLQYLHECSSQIIHCDIKPQNILLDDNLVPKISNFGVAKLLGGDQTRTSTYVRGTKGYLAPEWFKDPTITAKVDVYSFGMVLLDIICCKRHDERWALECFRTNSWEQLVEDDEEARADIDRVKMFTSVALSCIQDDPTLRPTMREVVHILAGDITVSHPAPSPTSVAWKREPSTF